MGSAWGQPAVNLRTVLPRYCACHCPRACFPRQGSWNRSNHFHPIVVAWYRPWLAPRPGRACRSAPPLTRRWACGWRRPSAGAGGATGGCGSTPPRGGSKRPSSSASKKPSLKNIPFTRFRSARPPRNAGPMKRRAASGELGGDLRDTRRSTRTGPVVRVVVTLACVLTWRCFPIFTEYSFLKTVSSNGGTRCAPVSRK